MEKKKQAAIWVDIVMRTLIIAGALNWGLIGFFDFNLVEWLSDHTLEHLDTVIYCLVGISALFYFLFRDYYLPFLGYTVFPCGSMTQKVPDNADTDIVVKVEPHVNVIYWASEHGNKVIENPWIAYSQYSNAGVVKSDQTGNAVLRVRSPAAYKVPGRTLSPHIHYRTCDSDGMLSRVKTVFIDGTHKK